MKKILIGVFILSAFAGMAQVKLGMKVAPVIAANRAKNDAKTVDNDGSKMKFSIGVIADKTLTDTYFLSSGLIYLPKRVAFSGNGVSESYRIQYLQIPATVKMFTNEIAPDVKAYLQVGSALEIKVFDERETVNDTTITNFTPIDIPVILAAGIEYRMGVNTVLFGGISYQRGLINTVRDARNEFNDLQIRNTIVSIDLGLKF